MKSSPNTRRTTARGPPSGREAEVDGSPHWLTFRQAKELGGVRRGERATRVVFWKLYKKHTGTEDKEVETISPPPPGFSRIL